MDKKNLSKSGYISIESIGNYCMVSPSTVRRWIKHGKLHAIKLPSGHFRVTVQDLKDFLRQYGLPIPSELL